MRLVPEWNWGRLNFWSQIAFAFGGLELGAIMGGEIRDPRRTVPRAAWISGLLIAGFYIAGTLAILAVLAPGDVNILSGLTQAAAKDPRLVALEAREQRLRAESLAVKRVLDRRWATYRTQLALRRQEIARASAVPAAPAAAAPRVRIVTLPPLTVTRTS